MWRMTVWSPYFDEKTAWFANGWVYDDAYAIYTERNSSQNTPNGSSRTPQGNRLYIPYGCSAGSCPQYAADISNLAYRHYWIENLKEELAHGYRGVFIDDVNMNMQVGNGSEQHVAPIDPSTGAADDRGSLAPLHGDVHAGSPRRAALKRNRPQRDLVRRRTRRQLKPRHQGGDLLRQHRQPRARRQRLRADRRQRPLVVERLPRLCRSGPCPAPRRGDGRQLARPRRASNTTSPPTS